MAIPTEPIGSIPRPLALIEAVVAAGDGADPKLDPLYEEAVRDTVERFEATGSPVITDGEQRKFRDAITYCVHGLANTALDGFKIPFAAGHTRRLARLTGGPFRYRRYADSFMDVAMRYAHVPVKQAVASPSALSLMYPATGIPGYSRDEFLQDLLREHETEVRRCLQKGAHKVRIDFTEGRLAVKIDPSGDLLSSFIDLNNLALSRFSAQDRQRIGVHTCPGSDRDSTHSAEVDAERDLITANEALIESSARLWLAMDAGHLGEWELDAATDQMTLGPRAAQMYSVPAWIPFPRGQLLELSRPQDSERVRKALEQALAEHADFDIEYRVNRRGGAQCWIASSGRGRHAPDGTVLGMAGVMQDITERKHAAQLLRRSEER